MVDELSDVIENLDPAVIPYCSDTWVGPDLWLSEQTLHLSQEQIASAIRSGLGIQLSAVFTTFDLSILRPEIAQLPRLTVDTVPGKVTGWDVLRGARSLRSLHIPGAQRVVELPFADLASLTAVIVPGTMAAHVDSAPRLESLSLLLGKMAPPVIETPVHTLLVNGTEVRDLDFLMDATRLEALRVVRARSFNATSLARASSLATLHFLMCHSVGGLSGIRHRTLDEFEIEDVAFIEDPEDLVEVKATTVRINKNHSIGQPLLDELKSRDRWFVADYRPAPAQRSKVVQHSTAVEPGSQDHESFAPFTIWRSDDHPELWTLTLDDLGQLSSRLPDIDEPSIYRLTDALDRYIKRHQPDLIGQLEFDSEADMLCVRAASKTAIDHAGLLAASMWAGAGTRWYTDPSA